MPPVPDPSSTPQAIAELESGLAALKQGDYATAIAQLESIPSLPDHPLTIKAQMGLVLAYGRVGAPLRAANLCQSLCASNNAQARDWATKTLSSLIERHPELSSQLQNKPLSTVENTEQPGHITPPDVPIADTEADVTGFTPLARSLPQPASTDSTGFVPLGSPPSKQPSRTNKTRGTQSVPASQPIQFSQTNNRKNLEDSTVSQTPTQQGNTYSRSTELTQQEQAETVAASAEAAIANSVLPYQPVWRQAERAKQWQPVSKVNLLPLWLLQAGTAVSLFWMVQTIIYTTMVNYTIVLTKIPFLELRRSLFDPPFWPILIALVVLLGSSRWILDGLLTVVYGLQPLSLGKLAVYSPETAQAIQRYCRQKQIPVPALGVLPTMAPVAFSYGFLPRFTRTVVSQGLLEQLADDEIAAIYASEVGHISTWTVPLMSLVTVVTQLPYTVYWVMSEWGNRQQQPFLRALASVLAAISYGLYALPRWMALWLSRQRLYYSDRIASESTGNPNGLTRALLKIAIGTAKDVQTQGKTSYLLEGFDLLTPLGQRTATTLGSIYPYAPIEFVLEWDRINPYCHWLAINNAHPPTGDRLNWLARYARQWRLSPELDFKPDSAPNPRSQKPGLTARQWKTLLLQGAPFFGLAIGLALGCALSSIGWVGARLHMTQLSWMYRDPALLRGLPLIGFSLGTFIRINPLFPELKFLSLGSTEDQPALVDLLSKPEHIPISSVPIQLEGNLLGRAGISNFLSQDLLLQTSTGVVRLHCLSQFGPVGNLLPQEIRPTDLIKQDVVVTGWFRRGAIPWIDVETLRTVGGRTSRSSHPIWSTLLGILSAAWGIYLLFRIEF